MQVYLTNRKKSCKGEENSLYKKLVQKGRVASDYKLKKKKNLIIIVLPYILHHKLFRLNQIKFESSNSNIKSHVLIKKKNSMVYIYTLVFYLHMDDSIW